MSNMLTALLVKEQPEFEHLHALFLQCLYWSVGGALLEDGKVKFDNYIKYICGLTQVDGKRAGLGEIPNDESLYEFYWDPEVYEWVAWKDKVSQYIHDPARRFTEILVPTVDTVRTTWLVENQVRIKRPALLVGETGTSKTATTQNFLRGI